MEKNFLNITPESGNGNQEVTVNAKANISLEDREEMLRIRSSTGKEASVRITQDGVPFMANIGVVPRSIFPSGTGYPIDITFSKTTWDSEGIPTTELKVSNTDEEKFEVIPYTIKGIEYYTAATDGSYYGEDFYATIGLCYEDEEVELF